MAAANGGSAVQSPSGPASGGKTAGQRDRAEVLTIAQTVMVLSTAIQGDQVQWHQHHQQHPATEAENHGFGGNRRRRRSRGGFACGWLPLVTPAVKPAVVKRAMAA